MSLQAVYEKFLQSPTHQSLATDATLQYVTTLKSINKDIVNHLEDQNKNIVKKKSEKIVSTVEGSRSIAVIVETTLQFTSHGGAYLPGLDSFIIDKVATLPITHFVSFDQNNKITQIRLSWDQGDLLKQAEVIGVRGKNWPVFSGQDQLKLITTSAKSANEQTSAPAPVTSPRGRDRGHADRSASPTKKYIRDPHASLDLSQHHEDERRPSVPNPVAPRQPHRPQERDMSDLFAAGHEDYQPSGLGASPKKAGKDEVVAPKGAGHKKFQPSRLFEDDTPTEKERQIYKTNPARYNHFNIGDEDETDSFQHQSSKPRQVDAPIRPKGGAQRGNDSQWDFEGFSTPEKAQGKVRGQDVVHFSYADKDEGEPGPQIKKQANGRKKAEAHFEFKDNGTPNYRPTVSNPRKENNSHFEFNDEPTPAGRRIIARTAAASKLYADPVFGGEEEEKPLKNVTNNARKDMASHWDMNDDSSAAAKAKQGPGRKGLESHWDVTDDNIPPNKPASRVGGRRENDKSFWDF